MLNETRVVETNICHDPCYKKHGKCISWSAVIAGAIVGFSISFLLNLFGVAIGLSAFKNTSEGMTAFTMGGFIGLIIVAIVSMFVAGMVAGHLARRYSVKRKGGILYGFLTFGVTLFLAMFFTSPLTGLVAHYNDVLGVPKSVVVLANPSNASSTVISPKGITTHAPAMNSNNSVTAANTEKNANDLGKATFLIFVLFAVGALSACMGGHCGMTCRCKDDVCDICVAQKTTTVEKL